MTMNSLRRADWLVDTISLAQADELVTRLHYAAGGPNTATFRHGLFRREYWPMTVAGTGEWQRVLALSRFVLEPTVPKNGASFLLARSSKLIEAAGGWDCLVTYADEWQGHVGTIYKAAGWEYVGVTKPERVYVLDGRMIARKAGPKTRTHGEMVALGAACVGAFGKHKFRKVLRIPEATHG